jgi:hypothetical protein
MSGGDLLLAKCRPRAGLYFGLNGIENWRESSLHSTCTSTLVCKACFCSLDLVCTERSFSLPEEVSQSWHDDPLLNHKGPRLVTPSLHRKSSSTVNPWIHSTKVSTLPALCKARALSFIVVAHHWNARQQSLAVKDCGASFVPQVTRPSPRLKRCIQSCFHLCTHICFDYHFFSSSLSPCTFSLIL